MKILLASDLHYRLPQLDWLVRRAPDFDLIVLAGDNLDISSPVSLDAQSIVMLRYFDLLKAAGNVAISSGNHDLTGPDHNGEQSALWLERAKKSGVPTDGDSLLINDTLITICPWWDGPFGRSELEKQLEQAASDRPKRWIWVYHWPPLDSPTCWTGRRNYGDADVLVWIKRYQPDMVLTGHVHQPPFKSDGHWCDRIGSTWIFNAGNQMGPVPSHIEIDLAAGNASWLSMMGEEQVNLIDEAAPARKVF